jgi:hypothetical protein
MIKNREKIEAKVRSEVSKYLDQIFVTANVPLHIMTDTEAKQHIINIGTAIMLNRLGVNTYPGSFVQAVLDNDLAGAFMRADSINSQSMKFYAMMIYNLSIEVNIEMEGD